MNYRSAIKRSNQNPVRKRPETGKQINNNYKNGGKDYGYYRIGSCHRISSSSRRNSRCFSNMIKRSTMKGVTICWVYLRCYLSCSIIIKDRDSRTVLMEPSQKRCRWGFCRAFNIPPTRVAFFLFSGSLQGSKIMRIKRYLFRSAILHIIDSEDFT